LAPEATSALSFAVLYRDICPKSGQISHLGHPCQDFPGRPTKMSAMAAIFGTEPRMSPGSRPRTRWRESTPERISRARYPPRQPAPQPPTQTMWPCRQSSVGSRQSVGSLQSTVGCQSAVFSRQSAVGNRQSAVDSRQSTVSRQSVSPIAT